MVGKAAGGKGGLTMANGQRLIDQGKVYEMACAGCSRHGETLGECNFDEPCERLVFAFTVAEPVDAVEVVRCKDCKKGHPELAPNGGVWCALWNHVFRDNGFCSKGERRTDG